MPQRRCTGSRALSALLVNSIVPCRNVAEPLAGAARDHYRPVSQGTDPDEGRSQLDAFIADPNGQLNLLIHDRDRALPAPSHSHIIHSQCNPIRLSHMIMNDEKSHAPLAICSKPPMANFNLARNPTSILSRGRSASESNPRSSGSISESLSSLTRYSFRDLFCGCLLRLCKVPHCRASWAHSVVTH